jgi:hypothetical protein
MLCFSHESFLILLQLTPSTTSPLCKESMEGILTGSNLDYSCTCHEGRIGLAGWKSRLGSTGCLTDDIDLVQKTSGLGLRV